MRIYKRDEFMKLPPGTAFCKGKEWYFNGVNFKGETIGNDWYEADPAWVDGRNSEECFERLEKMLNGGASYPMKNSECRDGYFDDEDLFLVFEEGDLKILRDWIDAAISASQQ